MISSSKLILNNMIRLRAHSEASWPRKWFLSLSLISKSRWETSISLHFWSTNSWWASLDGPPLIGKFPDKIFEIPSWEQKWTPVTDELLSMHLQSPQQEGHLSQYPTATINAEIQLIDESSFFEYILNHQICFKMNETLRNLLPDNFSF